MCSVLLIVLVTSDLAQKPLISFYYFLQFTLEAFVRCNSGQSYSPLPCLAPQEQCEFGHLLVSNIKWSWIVCLKVILLNLEVQFGYI